MKKSVPEIIYFVAVAYILISPILSLNASGPSVFQSWPMYTGTRDLCTMRFSDANGLDPNFNQSTQRLLNQTLFRGTDAKFILSNEKAAVRLLRAYCNSPETRERKFSVRLQCYSRNNWTEIALGGDTSCPN